MANSEDRKNLENAESAERAGKFPDRDYRVRVTKMLIRKQFTELLAAKPIQSITVRELCERTGINRSTFYNHYRDVYDLLEKIEEEMLAELAEQLKKIAGESGLMSVGFFEGIFSATTATSAFCTGCWKWGGSPAWTPIPAPFRTRQKNR